MKRFKYCTLGIQIDDYKHFTCPASTCPRNNEPLVIYHSDFNQDRIDEINWEWDYNKIGFNCRVQIHADRKLNGKLNVKILDQAD